MEPLEGLWNYPYGNMGSYEGTVEKCSSAVKLVPKIEEFFCFREHIGKLLAFDGRFKFFGLVLRSL